MKKVFIVDAGQWGMFNRAKGDYKDTNELLIRILEKEGEVAVEVVNDAELALQKIGSSVPEEDTTLLFTTRGMFRDAQEIKEQHPGLKVVVYSGLADDLPRDKGVVVLEKTAGDIEELREAILA
ncbi:MAG: hypothetical protein Q7S63_00195 [bacterium]|nr:hypothetical protein [bacterium]